MKNLTNDQNIGLQITNILGYIAGIIIVVLILTGPSYLVWNYIIVPKFNMPTLAYFDMFAIFVALKLMFPSVPQKNTTLNFSQDSDLDKKDKIS